MILLLPLLFACMPSTQRPVCVEKYAWADLWSHSLMNNKGFDWFDTNLRTPRAIWDGYDALLKIAPKNILVKVRAAWALEYMGNSKKDLNAASTLLGKLKKTDPDNPDVRFLSIAIGLTKIKRGTANSDNLKKLAQQAGDFMSKRPDYIGPHNARPKDLINLVGQLSGHQAGARD